MEKGIMHINSSVYGCINDNENDILYCIESALAMCSYKHGEPDVYEILDNVIEIILQHPSKKFYYFRGCPISVTSIEDMLEFLLDEFGICYVNCEGILINSCQRKIFEEWF